MKNTILNRTFAWRIAAMIMLAAFAAPAFAISQQRAHPAWPAHGEQQRIWSDERTAAFRLYAAASGI